MANSIARLAHQILRKLDEDQAKGSTRAVVVPQEVAPRLGMDPFSREFWAAKDYLDEHGMIEELDMDLVREGRPVQDHEGGTGLVRESPGAFNRGVFAGL